MKRKRSKAFNIIKLTDKQVDDIQYALGAAVQQHREFLCGDQLEEGLDYKIKRRTIKLQRELIEIRNLFAVKTRKVNKK